MVKKRYLFDSSVDHMNGGKSRLVETLHDSLMRNQIQIQDCEDCMT